MEEHVPTKITSSRYHVPWMNQNLKRLSRKNTGCITKLRNIARMPSGPNIKKLKNRFPVWVKQQKKLKKAGKQFISFS